MKSRAAASPPDPGSRQLGDLLRSLQEEEGVAGSEVVLAVEAAIATAWAQSNGTPVPTEVSLDPETGRLSLVVSQLVVEGEPSNLSEIGVEAARGVEPGASVGSIVQSPAEIPQAVADRAAHLARGAITQALRQAKRERLVTEASYRRWQLVDTIVEQVEPGVAYLRAGTLQAYLPKSEQIPRERLLRGQHLKVVLLEPRLGGGVEIVQIKASRSSPLLLRRLLETEVPELEEGGVLIRALVREPGERSKVAVVSEVEGVDAKGACIGPKGVRIRSVVSQLAGERVDLLEWSAAPTEFIARALAPAPVIAVRLDPAGRRATVEVAEANLSLAIGKEGQNARLAARLTGWRIDIRPPGTAP